MLTDLGLTLAEIEALNDFATPQYGERLRGRPEADKRQGRVLVQRSARMRKVKTKNDRAQDNETVCDAGKDVNTRRPSAVLGKWTWVRADEHLGSRFSDDSSDGSSGDADEDVGGATDLDDDAMISDEEVYCAV